MTRVSLMLILKKYDSNRQYVPLPFCWSWSACWHIIWKMGKNRGVNVEIAGVFGGMKKISWKACDKNKNPWKLSWAILSILDYWILLICIAKVLFRIENRLRLLMMCLEVLGEVFSWGYWEVVSEKLWPLVEPYMRISILISDRNLTVPVCTMLF